jgi:serine/threonine-protein kinase
MIQPQSILNGRYRVGRPLGEGGMAIVYAGQDLLLGRDVAIKALRAQFAADAGFRTRFEREARAAASLAHPNIIDVYDVGEVEGTPFLVMELVRGQSLKAIITAEAPFHPDDVAELLEQVGAALDYAHSKGYVHRDVKPGNILIDEHGRARVVDFGIAKGLADSDLTDTGAGLGTVGYLSPEQAEGLMATPASDIYAVGVVAFQMLTGQLPFTAETPVGVALRHLNDPAPAPSQLAASIPTPVDAIVLRALEKDPTRRWHSASAFAAALRNWRQGTQLPVTPPPLSTPTPPARAGPGLTVVVVLLVIGALAALLWAGFRGMPGTGDRDPTSVAPVIPTISGGIIQIDPDAAPRTPTVYATETPSIEITAAPTTQPPPTIAPAAEAIVVVPDLQGLTIAGANSALRPLGLRVAPGQPVFSDTAPLNAVAAQDPPPGSAVSPGTIVRVSLSRGASPFITGNGP